MKRALLTGFLLTSLTVFAGTLISASIPLRSVSFDSSSGVYTAGDNITCLGRSDATGRMNWEGTGIAVNVKGTAFEFTVKPDNNLLPVNYCVFVDGSQNSTFTIPQGVPSKTVSVSLPDNGNPVHHVEVFKASEASIDSETFSVTSSSNIVQPSKAYKISYYGDSITAGFIDDNNRPPNYDGSADLPISYSFKTTQALNKALCPHLTVKAFNASYIALSGIGVAKSLPSWNGHTMFDYFQQAVYQKGPSITNENADIVVVNIGTNDIIARCDAQSYQTKLLEFLEKLGSMNTNAHIFVTIWGMFDLKNQNPDFYSALKAAVEQYKPVQSEKVYFVEPYWSASGVAAKHPSEKFAQEFADYLKNKIVSNLPPSIELPASSATSSSL
ncbi:GDSL-type esterase/lipase family protein [Lentisphaerota bacterium ZTH]|nr:hypothetical protein JYG24_12475 [Lentisphaerota bacterium]WET05696.1 GDSL-type esterase/lipase family protein [Lentisphaerota bacterium ZTH]